MKRFLLVTIYIILLFFFFSVAHAQSNQTFTNGATTTPISFPSTGCIYNWTNSNPAIGLPASGTGNIPAFTAANTGNSPITATITATPESAGFAYIANTSDGTVSVISVATNTEVYVIPINTTAGPVGVNVNPDHSRVYVANSNNNTISIINTATNTITSTISSGLQGPWMMAFSPDGSKLYTTNTNSNTVSVINTATNAVLSTIAVGKSPVGICVSPDGSRIYVANRDSKNYMVIDAGTNNIIATIATNITAEGITLSPDGNTLYLADANLEVINAVTNKVISSITTGYAPDGICVSADGSKVYVTNANSNTVSVINAATNSVIATIPVGTQPQGLSLNADNSKLYVTNYRSNTVSVINTVTNAVTSTIAVGAFPYSFGNFITGGNGCSTITFNITVSPSSLAANFSASPVTGTIATCQGVASASPNVQQFTVSGNNLSDNITVTAPAGFELYMAGGSGWSNSVVINQVSGAIKNAVLQVRASATAPAGNISGNVVLTSGTSTQNVAVKATVNALPTVNKQANQTYTNGQVAPAVNFTGTANVFNWVNDNPAIGLPASGTGGIPSFTAINTGTNPVKANITITPTSVGYAYIANLSDNTVSVINTTTNAIAATIPVGQYPFGVSVSPDQSKVYVTNEFSDNVSVINVASNKVVATIPVGSNPSGIIVSPDGSKVYVANEVSHNVQVINSATNAIESTIDVGVNPMGLALNPGGSILYVTNYNSGTVSVINTVTDKVTNTITVDSTPNQICVSPDGSRAYAACGNSGTIMVIDASLNTVITKIKVGIATGVLLNADGSRLYVTNTGNDNISVINTATNTVISTFAAGVNPASPNLSTNPCGESMSPDGSMLYVTDYGANTLLVINTATNAVISTIPVGTNPVSLGNFIVGGSNCGGVTSDFTITVNAAPLSGISSTGSLSPLSTTYGTPSSSVIFTVSGVNLKAGILVTPPAGFEVSADDIHFSPVITVGTAGNIAATTVYIRLAATTLVNDYTGNIVMSSAGTGNITLIMPKSTVSPAQLVITADDKHKLYGYVNPVLTASYTGFVNKETSAQLTTLPIIVTTATLTSPIGKYAITASGAVAQNYDISYLPGVLTVDPAAIIVPNTFTPNGDGINDVWNIKYLNNFPECTVNIFNRYGAKLYTSIGYAVPWDGTYNNSALPAGTYYYIIDPKNGTSALSGWVAIIR